MRKFISLTIAAILLAATLGASGASAQANPYVRLYENNGAGGDSLKFNVYPPYVSGYANLNNVATPSGVLCSRAFLVEASNWNDCFNSIKLYIGGQNVCVTLYSGINYTKSEPRMSFWGKDYADGTVVTFGTSFRDTVTSIKWITATDRSICSVQ
jgi:hypothetical protein